MVLAEKNNDTTSNSSARNGRRSRGPSPNGLHPPQLVESSSEDESSVPVDKIRVGRDYQAVCPELQPEILRKPELIADRALLVWSPTDYITDGKLEEYIVLAKDKYGYNGEQALGMLFWHKHDLERAVLDLANFTPFPDEWSVEDKVLFEQAFQFHGKSFHRIRQMLPDKSIASLVKYYYGWKKTRSRTSLMDKQARKLQVQVQVQSAAAPLGNVAGKSDDDIGNIQHTAPSIGGEHNHTSDPNSANDDSDHEDKKWTIHRGIRRKSRSPLRTGQTVDENSTQGEKNGGACSNCGVCCSYTHTTPKGPMCNSCYVHWRRTGVLRPTHGPTPGIKRGSNGGNAGATSAVGRSLAARHKRRPPRGMYMNHDDLAAMASQGAGIVMLQGLAREQDALQRQIQQNKQIISSLKRKHSNSIEDLRPTIDNSSKLCNKWALDERLLAVDGFKKYGKDFKAISEVVGNKTEQHVRVFYINYRKKYALDTILRAWESKHNTVNNLTNNNNTVNNGNTGLAVTTDSSNVQLHQEQPLVIPSIDITSDNEENADIICITPSPPPSFTLTTPTRSGRDLKSNGKISTLPSQQTLQLAK